MQIIIFTAVKNCGILHGHVIVMMRKSTINHSYVELFLKITFQTMNVIPKLYITTERLPQNHS